MQKHFNDKEKFTFCQFQQDEVIRIIKGLPKNKTLTFKDIPVKIMFNSVLVYSQNVFYDFVKSVNFQDLYDITTFLKYF